MRRKLTIPFIILGALLFFALTTAESCDAQKPKTQVAQENRTTSTDQRNQNFARAVAKYPQPNQENFPMREALVKFTQRQDLLNHPWYVYVANDCMQCPNGVAYQYYIGQTYPQSTCNFLGSTEDVQWADYSKSDERGPDPIKIQAPSLDGIYYGSGATTGGCDYFFFDVADDGMVVIHHDWKWFVKDRPLVLDAKLMVSPR